MRHSTTSFQLLKYRLSVDQPAERSSAFAEAILIAGQEDEGSGLSSAIAWGEIVVSLLSNRFIANRECLIDMPNISSLDLVCAVTVFEYRRCYLEILAMRNQLASEYTVRTGNIFLAFIAAASLMTASATPSFAWGGGNSNSKSSPCTSIDIGHLFAQNGSSDIDTISTNLVAQNPCPPFQLGTSKNKAKFRWKGAPGAKDIDFHIDPNDIKPGEKKSWDKSLGGDFGGADHVDYKIVNMPGAPSGYGMQITYADYAGTPLSVPSTPLPITFGN